MSIVESLINGKEHKRDIFLVIMVWMIGYLLSVAMSMSFVKLSSAGAIDVSAENSASSVLSARIPIPAGQFSVMLPKASKVGLGEDARTIIVKLPVDMGFSGLGVSVEMSPKPYEIITPAMISLRKKSFLHRISDNGLILSAPFTAKKLDSFEAIVSNGRMGYQARMKGDKVDKFYVEVYQDTRRFMFEIAVSGGALTKKHRDLLYAVVNSTEDFKELKKEL